MTKTIYLANPYGFSVQQKATLLPPLVAALEALGLEVWEPFARNNQQDFTERGWAYRIGQADVRDVVDADAIFAVLNLMLFSGMPEDGWEDWYYTSLEEIAAPDKALARWAASS